MDLIEVRFTARSQTHVLIWFGRPIEPRPNWRQMGLPIKAGFGPSSEQEAVEAALLNAHDPPLDVDELPGTLHSWYRDQGRRWIGVVSYKYPVHGEGMSLSEFIDSIPAERLRRRPPSDSKAEHHPRSNAPEK